MGEGWHNNHHHYPSSANQGFFWWEIDVTYYLLCAMSRLGLIWEVRRPPQRIIDAGRASRGASAEGVGHLRAHR
jgi:stearoyl-CoA desaturase (delta-9 desaturase)